MENPLFERFDIDNDVREFRHGERVAGEALAHKVGRQKSEVGRQKSEVRGQRSEVGRQRSEVRGQKSEVRGQKAGVRGQKSVKTPSLTLRALTSVL